MRSFKINRGNPDLTRRTRKNRNNIVFIFLILYIFYIFCRENSWNNSLIISCFKGLFWNKDHFIIFLDKILFWICFYNWNRGIIDKIKKVTRFDCYIPGIGECINRKGYDSHKCKWSRSGDAPDFSNTMSIDYFNQHFWKCRCIIKILDKRIIDSFFIIQKYWKSDLRRKWIDIECWMHFDIIRFSDMRGLRGYVVLRQLANCRCRRWYDQLEESCSRHE